MLLKINGQSSERLHAPFISEECIARHVSSLCQKNDLNYENYLNYDEFKNSEKENITTVDFKNHSRVQESSEDEYYQSAVLFVQETGQASTSSIQSKFKIGYPRAFNIIRALQEKGVIGQERMYYNGPYRLLI